MSLYISLLLECIVVTIVKDNYFTYCFLVSRYYVGMCGDGANDCGVSILPSLFSFTRCFCVILNPNRNYLLTTFFISGPKNGSCWNFFV